MDKKKILPQLLEMISDNKKELFEKVLDQRTRHLTVIIENMYQDQNASAVIRSAECFGVQDLHIIENTNKLRVNPDIALGSKKWIDVHQYYKNENNTIECIENLKSQGYTIAATTPHTDDILISELPIENKTALLFGTELTGLSDLAMESADVFVKVPMSGFTESFNLSVSAAICMYDFTNRLRNSEVNWQLSDEERFDLLFEWVKKTINRSEKIIKMLESK